MSTDAVSMAEDEPDDGAEEAEKVRRLEAVAPLVRAMCASRLRGRDSGDAAQAVLEQVWRAQHQQHFGDEESVRRYAATVARVVQPFDDRRSVRAAPVGSVAEALWVDETAGPAEQFDRTEAMAEAAAKVQALLERLTPRERDVIRASQLGERDTAEVAAELGLTPSGVRSAQTRAMARMRETAQAPSSNPLASGVPERERRRAAERQAGRGFPTGPRSVPVIDAARRFAAEQGRPPSRSELVGLTGTSEGTAQRVVRALREEQGAPYEAAGPVRARALAEAQRHGEVHGHRPDSSHLVHAAGVSTHTAREVLQGLRSTDERDLDEDEEAQRRRPPSPAYDRAEQEARRALAETGELPTWRAVHEAADVGRSTAAGMLRNLRAERARQDGFRHEDETEVGHRVVESDEPRAAEAEPRAAADWRSEDLATNELTATRRTRGDEGTDGDRGAQAAVERARVRAAEARAADDGLGERPPCEQSAFWDADGRPSADDGSDDVQATHGASDSASDG